MLVLSSSCAQTEVYFTPTASTMAGNDPFGAAYPTGAGSDGMLVLPPQPAVSNNKEKDEFDDPAGGKLQVDYIRKEYKLIAAAVFAEFIGTLFLVLIAVGIEANEIKVNNDISTNNADLRFNSDFALTIALMFGITYAVLHSTFEKISGAHFNPAITIAAVVARREKLLPGFALIIAQLVGALAGAGIYDAMTGHDAYGELGTAKVNSHFDSGAIFGVELLCVMFIAMVWFLHCDLTKTPLGRFRDPTGPLYVGLAYAAAAGLTSRWDRVCLNPARAFGPAAIRNEWSDHWVYWIGPCFGGAAGALFFELLVWLSGGDRARRLSSWV